MSRARNRLALLGGEPVVTVEAGPGPGLSAAAVERASALVVSAREDRDRLSAVEGNGEVRRFEKAFARQAGAAHAVSTASGTGALMAALAACGVGPGDEVIIAAYGWGGTAGAVLALGATPVFVDVDPHTFTLNAERTARSVSSRTSAILATHLFGHPADITGLRSVAREHGLRLVFDAAQALGASYRERPVGGLGDISVFSFGRGKLLSAGEGGMATTNDRAIYERLLLASQHPVRALRELNEPHQRRLADELSLSLRIHPMAAAIGNAELRRVPDHLRNRRRICQKLAGALDDVPGFVAPTERPPADHAYHRFALTYRAEKLGGLRREVALEALRAEGVPVVAGPVGTPVHERPRFLGEGSDRTRRPPLGRRLYVPAPTPVADRRCLDEEVLLESSTRWLATPEERVDQLALAFRKLGEQHHCLSGAFGRETVAGAGSPRGLARAMERTGSRSGDTLRAGGRTTRARHEG